MEKYIGLEIPFQTKGKIKKLSINDHYVMNGIAYFIFDLDLKMIVDEYIQIIESNYRVTDERMINTSHYKNNMIREFRNNYLDKYFNEIKDNLNDWQKNRIKNKKSLWILLNNEQIKEVNNYFKNTSTTVKNLFATLKGSNITGAHGNPNATEMRCTDTLYFDCNFANVIKKFYCEKDKKNKSYPRNISFYGLNFFLNNEEMLAIIPEFKKQFKKYNNGYEYKGIIPDIITNEEEQLENLYNEINNKIDKFGEFIIDDQQDLFIDYLLSNYKSYDEIENKDQVDKKLRAFFAKNINYYIKNNKIPFYSTVKKFEPRLIENAHIIGFRNFKNNFNKEEIKKSINPYNCLRIDSNTHTLFDKNKIIFDESGSIYNLLANGKKELKIEKYLDIDNIPTETIKFIKML